jgi:hypothetical protein
LQRQKHAGVARRLEETEHELGKLKQLVVKLSEVKEVDTSEADALRVELHSLRVELNDSTTRLTELDQENRLLKTQLRLRDQQPRDNEKLLTALRQKHDLKAQLSQKELENRHLREQKAAWRTSKLSGKKANAEDAVGGNEGELAAPETGIQALLDSSPNKQNQADTPSTDTQVVVKLRLELSEAQIKVLY